MLEFFGTDRQRQRVLPGGDRRRLAEDRQPQLPLPPQPLVSGQPQFFYAESTWAPVRVARRAPMDPPLYNDKRGRIIVQVAESLETRQDFLHRALVRSVERDLAVVMISVLVVIWSCFMALRPLERLREEVASRSADDLSPVRRVEMPGRSSPSSRRKPPATPGLRPWRGCSGSTSTTSSHQLHAPLSVLRTQTAMPCVKQTPRRSVQPSWRCRTAWTGRYVPLTRCLRWRAARTFAGRGRPAAGNGRPGRAGRRRHRALFARLPGPEQLDLGLDAAPVRVQAVEWLLRGR